MPNIKKESHTGRFYFVGNEKVPLIEATDVKAVRLEGMPERPARASSMAANVMRPDGGEDIGILGITIYRNPTPTTPTGPVAAATARGPADPVAQAFPVLRSPQLGPEEALVLTPQIVVQFQPTLNEGECRRLLTEHRLEVISYNELAQNNFICKVKSGSPDEALAIANELHQKDQVEYAQPDFVRLMPKVSTGLGFALGPAAAPAVAPERVAEAVPAPLAPDPFVGSQWGLTKIKAIEAWAITRGDPNIKVAVIDEGVDMAHEDLAANLLTGYDSVDNDNNQQPNPRDGHGTACAGIVAAISQNGRGVAGVAPNCKVIPVRIAVGTPSGGWATTDSMIARGIRTAVDRGADVLSNSWGGGPASNLIQSAFTYARTNGRGGKGAFAPCATGNDDVLGVIYPARYPQCFAVGASNEYDQRKSRTSADGENWWGSNFGPEVQVVAPGVHIYTADIMGAAGYNAAGNYIPNFNGTSSATPHVAGVGALVLSVDPNLRVQEIEEIIRRSADDVASSGRDNETGFGRVNALRAVRAAARVWYDVAVALEFLGRGRECFMRINLRVYNSGINRVRLNHVLLRSFTPDWATMIDRLEFTPKPGGIMEPFTGDDIRIDNILLRANGNQSAWSYRWSLNYSYTYWRPILPATALDGQAQAPRQGSRRIEQFNDQASTETASYRFEGKGRGRTQVPSDEPTELAAAGTQSLPVTFAAGPGTEPTNEGPRESGELITRVGEQQIIIEKIGDTVRIKI